jgi:hypothetical protein
MARRAAMGHGATRRPSRIFYKKTYKSQAQLAADMVNLGVHEGPAAVARAVGQSMDSATAHIAFYLRNIRRLGCSGCSARWQI